MSDPLAQPLQLPCGVVIPNRICKAATTECLSDDYNRATEEHARLYRAWSEGGCGLIITGNFQIDRRYMERPGNVAIDGIQDEEQLARLRNFSKNGTVNGNQLWVQIGHAGRQSEKLVNVEGVGPSAGTFVSMDNSTIRFREISLDEIKSLPARFAYAAKICQLTGFTGVQIHSAHGYLLSSFLSPKSNKRTDEYGGSIENRSRLLLETLAAVREAVGPKFAVGIKINSSDFQQGGFTVEECAQVVDKIEAAGLVDLIELSGGNYENPALLVGGNFLENLKSKKNKSTEIREAYFMEFSKAITSRLKRTKVMVTGGIRSRETMERALASGDCDMIGVARPVCGMDDCVAKLLRRDIDELPRFERDLVLPSILLPLNFTIFGPKLRFLTQQLWYYFQEIEVGSGRGINKRVTPLGSVIPMITHDTNKAKSLKGLTCVGLALNAKPSKVILLAKAAFFGAVAYGTYFYFSRKSL